MAKVNLQIDWKAWLLAHGEKIGIGLVSFFVIMLVWSAIRREGMPVAQQPTDIAERTQAARRNVELAEWDTFPNRPDLKNFGSRSVMDQLDRLAYRTEARFEPELWPRLIKRSDPPLLPVVELEAQSGFGPFAIQRQADGRRAANPRSRRARRPTGRRLIGPEGLLEPGFAEGSHVRGRELADEMQFGGVDAQGKVEGRTWILVTGLVPVKQQLARYQEAFSQAEAYDEGRDVPEYLGCVVERAQVVAKQPLQWKKVMSVSRMAIEKATADWATTAPELASEECLHENLTYPLGPLLLNDWPESVVHSKIPLAPSGDDQWDGRPEEGPEPPETPSDASPDDVFLGRAEPEFGRRGLSGPVADPARLARSGRRPAVGGPRHLVEGQQAGRPTPDYFLLRLFDFSVETGASYRYRVRLVIQDPNFSRNPERRIARKHLKEEVIARLDERKPKGYLLTEPSQPSPLVSIPRPGSLIAGNVKAPLPGRFSAEPIATTLVKTYDQAMGMWVEVERKMTRGSVTQFRADAQAIHPARRQVVRLAEQAIDTGMVLLDIRGGQRIAERGQAYTAPAELLLLDATGRLFVQRELDGAAAMARHHKIFDASGEEASDAPPPLDQHPPGNLEESDVDFLLGNEPKGRSKRSRRSRPR